MQQYRIENYFSTDQKDTLLADMVTFIGVKPKTATTQTRFESEFRPYYVAYSRQFQIIYFYVNNEADHYYYLIRPARSLAGTTRGVGGRFRLENEKITDFEEVFNTPVFDEDKLFEIGETLFLEMIETGDVNRYLGNKLFIEWPDDRLRYHKGLHEWRYDVELE
ncbi:MAG: hypothetical protein K0B09_04830 [Bacteroidales bacterium]|nr:hypothetical protein [Bacteroidales bacterium]